MQRVVGICTTTGTMKKSQSIPIQREELSAAEIQKGEEKRQSDLIADYQDFVFCSRIVNGMKERQKDSRRIDLRYQNQALIDHVVITRSSPRKKQMPADRTPSSSLLRATLNPYYRRSNSHHENYYYTSENMGLVGMDVGHRIVSDDEEEMMFEMDS